MDTQTQIERLIELAIIQRSELKRLVDELPQLREHLSSEIEKTFEDAEPQLRAELEEFIEKRATDATAKTGAALEAKIKELSSNLEISTQARFNAIIAEREENARLAAQAEAKIAEHAASLPSAVKEIVSAELARFPRAGEIDQLRKEFAEPRGLNPRGKWQAGESYNKLDLVTINGDSYTSNTDGNRTRPSRSSADWTLVAARGTGGGGGPTSLSELTTVPSDGDILIGSGTSWVTSNLTAGAGISITVGPGAITISATDGDITLDDGTAASPSLHFTNDPDTGIYRPAANTLGISVSGTQVAYFDENGLTVPSAGVVAGGSIHAGNGNANNPSLSFDGDQDTGFFRHQPNEIGVSLGGTQKATLTSTTFSITPNLSTSGNLTVSGTASVTGQINGSAGYQFRAASGTTYELLRYAGGTNNPGIFTTVNESTKKVTIFASGSLVSGQTLGLGAEGSEALTLGAANATLAGNLTVSGTGTSSVAGSFGVGTTTPNKLLEAAKNLATNTVGAGEVLRLISDDGNTVGRVTEIGFGVGPTGGATYAPITLGAVVTLASGYNKKDFYIATRDATTDSAPSERLRLFANGNLFVGASPVDGGQKLQVSGTAAISGALSIGNTVQTAASVASTHKVTISIGGTTYYLLATNV